MGDVEQPQVWAGPFSLQANPPVQIYGTALGLFVTDGLVGGEELSSLSARALGINSLWELTVVSPLLL